MLHTCLRNLVLTISTSPLAARAKIAGQIVDPVVGIPDHGIAQKSFTIGRLTPYPVPFLGTTINQAGAGMADVTAMSPPMLVGANSAIVKQAAGLTSATKGLTDPTGTTSLIERLGLGNTGTIEQTGSGGFVRVTQGAR